MKPSNTMSSTVPTLAEEHQALQEEIAVWRNWWDELSQLGQPHFGEMGDRLSQFREHLAGHFRHEESTFPTAGEAGALFADAFREHAQVLAELDQLVDRLRRCGPDVGCWGNARNSFEEFLDRLHAHETREAELLAKQA